MDKAFYSYQPSDLDDELFLSDIPLDVLTSSIRSQFDEPLEYRKKDYVQSFITKYEYTLSEFEGSEELDIETYHDLFISFMCNIMNEYLNIGFVDIDNKPEEYQHEIIHLTYRFFIKNIKKNFVTAVINYIESHKDDILMSVTKRKDVTALNFKTEIDNEFDIMVLANLSYIINDTLEEIRTLFDVDDFFELCKSDEYVLELEYVKKGFEDMEITGNFIEKYTDMIDDTFRTELESKIRNIILRKYSKRSAKVDLKKKAEEESPEESSDESEG